MTPGVLRKDFEAGDALQCSLPERSELGGGGGVGKSGFARESLVEPERRIQGAESSPILFLQKPAKGLLGLKIRLSS